MFSTICKNQGRIAKQLIVQLAIIFYLTGCSEGGEEVERNGLIAITQTTDVPEVTLIVDSTTVGMNDDEALHKSVMQLLHDEPEARKEHGLDDALFAYLGRALAPAEHPDK